MFLIIIKLNGNSVEYSFDKGSSGGSSGGSSDGVVLVNVVVYYPIG